MALTRGKGGNCPCPVCFVRKEDLSKISSIPDAPLRTQAHTAQVIAKAFTMKKTDADAYLQQYGLRLVQVSPSSYLIISN